MITLLYVLLAFCLGLVTDHYLEKKVTSWIGKVKAATKAAEVELTKKV